MLTTIVSARFLWGEGKKGKGRKGGKMNLYEYHNQVKYLLIIYIAEPLLCHSPQCYHRLFETSKVYFILPTNLNFGNYWTTLRELTFCGVGKVIK